MLFLPHHETPTRQNSSGRQSWTCRAKYEIRGRFTQRACETSATESAQPEGGCALGLFHGETAEGHRQSDRVGIIVWRVTKVVNVLVEWIDVLPVGRIEDSYRGSVNDWCVMW